MIIEEQDFFQALKNESGEIALLIEAKDEEPENPQFFYDGNDRALMQYNEDFALLFENFEDSLKENLKKTDKIAIIEIAEKFEDKKNVPANLMEATEKAYELPVIIKEAIVLQEKE